MSNWVISINTARDACSCNKCHVHNYKSTLGNNDNIVDRLHEVVIGTHVIILCDNCLKELKEAVNSYQF